MTLLEHKSVFKETKHYLLSLLGKILLLTSLEKVILELMTPLSLLGTAMVADFLLVPGWDH